MKIGKQRAFLAAYRETASITKAAERSKIHRHSHYRWLEADPAYVLAFAEAQTEAAQLLEDEAIRRAHEGILTPVFYKGNPTGVMREYSDGLLMFLLRGFAPEKYRDRGSVEVSGPAGGPIAVNDTRLEALSDEELNSLITISQKLDSAS